MKLEQRIARLERQMKWWRTGCVVLAASAALAVAAGAQRQAPRAGGAGAVVPPPITTSGIRIVGPDGKTVATFASKPGDGGGMFSLHNAEGVPMFAVSTQGDKTIVGVGPIDGGSSATSIEWTKQDGGIIMLHGAKGGEVAVSGGDGMYVKDAKGAITFDTVRAAAMIPTKAK